MNWISFGIVGLHVYTFVTTLFGFLLLLRSIPSGLALRRERFGNNRYSKKYVRAVEIPRKNYATRRPILIFLVLWIGDVAN
jgi:hypothetical protein